MLHWIAHWVGAMGYLGVALLMAAENVVFPLPSELIMPLAGFSASRGHMTVWGAIVAGTAGSVLGSLPVYYAARMLGEERIAKWVERYGQWFLLRAKDLRLMDQRLREHGTFAVFVGQLLPAVRGLVALPAGWARMNVVRFTAVNLAGRLIWCTFLVILGDTLGARFREVHKMLGPIIWGLGAVVLFGAGAWLVRRRLQARI